MPQDSSPPEPTSTHTSAFSNYPSHQKQEKQQLLKPQSQSIFTSGRPLSYVQQPPPPPPPPPAQPPAGQPPSNRDPAQINQQQGPQPPPPPSQSGSSFPSFLLNRSAPDTQNTTSQPQPPPPAAPQSGSSFPSFVFNQSAPDTQNTSSQSSPNMNPYNISPRRSPPPPPSHFTSHPNDSSLSAEHYLRQINSGDNPPVRVVKPSAQNVVYRKEIRIRYLQPPTPPPPAPIIIREKHIPPNPPESVYINLFSSSRIYQFVSFLCIATSHS